MKKTPIVFLMDYENDQITSQVRTGCEWVVNGEGTPTIKYDGQAALWKDGKLWKRYDRKLNKKAQARYNKGLDLGPITMDLFKDPPDGFVPCEDSPDPVSYHWPGWVPVSKDNPADVWFLEALANLVDPEDGQTFELVGPSLAKNVYNLDKHELWKHGKDVVDLPDRSIDAIKSYLQNVNHEGIVFHHPDGRMAKIRKKDFKMFWVQEDMRPKPKFRKSKM